MGSLWEEKSIKIIKEKHDLSYLTGIEQRKYIGTYLLGLECILEENTYAFKIFWVCLCYNDI